MKHLNKREDFLKRSKHSKILNIINEAGGPFTNDIPWGDSLVGRLINSFLRKAKIGYNSTKIEPLLDAFKAELDILISNSLSRDNKKEFDTLQIKALFHKIKQVCVSSEKEEDKLDELIGGHQNLWDENEKWNDVLTFGLLPDCYEYIDTKVDDNQLSIKKDVILLELSKFIDNLRKLTNKTNLDNNLDSDFVQIFGKLINKFSVVNESVVGSYHDQILLERTDADMIKKLEQLVTDRERQLKTADSDKLDSLKNELDNYKRQLDILKNKNKNSNKNNIIKTNGLDKTSKDDNKDNKLVNTTKTVIVSKDDNKDVTDSKEGEAETGLIVAKETGLSIRDINDKIRKIKELAIKCKAGNLKTTDEILKYPSAIEFIKITSTLDQEDLDYIKRKNPKEKDLEIDISKLNNAKEVKAITLQEEKQKESQDSKKEPEMQNSSYIYESNEESPINVLVNWNIFVKDGKIPPELINVTEEEIKKIEKSVGSNSELNYDISKNPDPIISICRIFKRANDIYFTPVIPSGRSGGKVSNKTFLEYEKLGGGSSNASDANSPGYGPWAVKSLRNSWVDGVTKILGDQSYRKILSNLKFIVPGSKDKFNEKLLKSFGNFIKIYEADESAVGGKLGVDKKSHGQILFDFINAMLDGKTAANFDEQKNILLKKYFEPYGLKVTNIRDKSTKPIVKQAECDAKTIFWTPTSGFGSSSIQSYSGQFFAIPITNDNVGKHDMIFMHLLKRVSLPGVKQDCYYIKFVFDNQSIITKYKDVKHSDYEITTDWSTQDSPTKNVYYGIITKITNYKFTLVYGNVAGGKGPGKLYGKKNGFTQSNSGIKKGSKGDFNVCLSVLVESEVENISKQISTDFCGQINGELNTHAANLNIECNDPDFKGKLLLALTDKLKKELNT